MLNPIIRAVMQQLPLHAGNGEVIEAVMEVIPPEQVTEALREALAPMVSVARSQANRQLLKDAARTFRASQDSLAAAAGGRTAAASAPAISPRTALLLEDRLLQFCITGLGGRSVPLGRATATDLRADIDASRKRGESMLRRADILDEMLHEVAAVRARTVAALPPESRRKFAQRLADAIWQ